MRRFVLTPPPSLKSSAHGVYQIGEATLTVGELGPLPEDLTALVARQFGGAMHKLESRRLPGGWPVFVVVTPARILLVVRVLERGVIAQLDGSAKAVEAARLEVLAVLDAAKVEWDERPFYTLAELFEGV